MSRILNKSVAVVGAGPAGMAAALQLQRFGIEAVLFEAQSKTGSPLKNAWLVENYLGRPFKTEPFFDHLEGKN